MTRRLVLVRHAKAVAEGRTDADRPLADRGRADAPAIGRWLAEHGVVPDRVVVSPAVRARQTWDLAATGCGASVVAVVDDRVYANSVEDLLGIVSETPADVTTLALVGHNPSIEALAATLDDGRGPATARAAMAEKYPTSGVAVLAVPDGWNVAPGAATLTDFAVPRA